MHLQYIPAVVSTHGTHPNFDTLFRGVSGEEDDNAKTKRTYRIGSDRTQADTGTRRVHDRGSIRAPLWPKRFWLTGLLGGTEELPL